MRNLEERFTSHVMNDEQIKTSNAVRTAVIITAKTFESLPEGREKALAMTKLEEALMWANKSIVLEEL